MARTCEITQGCAAQYAECESCPFTQEDQDSGLIASLDPVILSRADSLRHPLSGKLALDLDPSTFSVDELSKAVTAIFLRLE